MTLTNKRSFYQLLLTMVVFLLALVFQPSVLADGNDNLICGGTDGDSSAFFCNECQEYDTTITWVADGNWTWGNPKCCGDDYEEYYDDGMCKSMASQGEKPIRQCGETISESGSYYLQNDLNCNSTALTINASNVTLFAEGKTISSGGGGNYNGVVVNGNVVTLNDMRINGFSGHCLYITGDGVDVNNGRDIGCTSGAIYYNGVSGGKVRGTSTSGATVRVSGSSGVTLENNTLKGGSQDTAIGFYVTGSNSITISGNTISGTQIGVLGAGNSTMTGNTGSGGSNGVSVGGNGNVVSGNNFSATQYGLKISSGSGNYGCNNTVSSCENCQSDGNYIIMLSDKTMASEV